MKSHLIHLVIWLIIVLLAFVGYGFFYAVISQKSAEVAGLQEKILAKTEAVSRITSAREALSEIAGDESLVQGYFVPENGVVAFIDVLQKKSRAQGSTMNILSVSQGEESMSPTLVFSLSIDGKFDAVMRTVGVIEYAPYAISVAELSLAQTEKGEWRADMKIAVGSVAALTTTP